MNDWAAYSGMFSAALLAATILPAQSEAVLVALLLAGKQQPWLLILVASIGNTIGSCINWWLGRYLEHFRARRWFPANGDTLSRAQRWYGKVGRWSLLLCWLPIIGDPLTLVAGLMRERFTIFLIFVAVAKTVRYIALAAVTLGIT